MNRKTTFCFQIFILAFSVSTLAQDLSGETGGMCPIIANDLGTPCITVEQYAKLEQRIKEIPKASVPNSSAKTASVVTYAWPLQTAPGYKDCGYYYWGAHVDQDTAGAFKDYNCGTLAYHAHRGTDIPIFPYPFYKMDHNQVQVIAAAPGTIVQKSDGNFDKDCAATNATANYLIIQHSDGSYGLYWHLKMGSLTAKAVGQTVTLGEFLGIVGSSGSSTAPHLHFEIWANNNSNSLEDPFQGACNSLNATSLWVNQKPYTEPAVITASVNTAAPVFPACPATETSNEDSCFAGGGTAKFVIFMRNETAATTVNMRIVNPNGTTFSSWTHNCANTYSTPSYYFWTKPLPTISGIYTFETTYNALVCSKPFTINCSPAGIAEEKNQMTSVLVYPNPSNGSFRIETGNFKIVKIEAYNALGKIVYSSQSVHSVIDLSSESAGYYLLRIYTKEEIISKKLIIQ
jgi:murein DD-endopeptidase MepM/ murein hydrolase activator NlpD